MVFADWYVKTRADIWICSASGGEAYLTEKLLEFIAIHKPGLQILLTSWTRQGYDILEQARHKYSQLNIQVRFVPFDDPQICARAIKQANPKLLVLLETELWPGLMQACTVNQTKIIILNARISEKTFKYYKILKILFAKLNISPAHIAAISKADAKRFETIFPQSQIEVLPNIKFDRASFEAPEHSLKDFFSTCTQAVLLLASVRKEEEDVICSCLKELPLNKLSVIIAPRHLHREKAWKDKLDKAKLPNISRSELNNFPQEQIVIWNKFGELQALYQNANVCFVGGSLAKLGGQNFLEALSCGLVPITGPNLKNFAWAMEGLIEQNLLDIVHNHSELSLRIIWHLEHAKNKCEVKNKFKDWLSNRQGGSLAQAKLILDQLS